MSVLRGRAVPAMVIVGALFAGSTLGSYAANGGPLLLGKSNKATKTTTIKTTGNGAALKLKSKPGKAPLKVSNGTKVAKLNADLVDGLQGAALQTAVYRYRLPALSGVSSLEIKPTGLPPGRYVASYSLIATTTVLDARLECNFTYPSSPTTANEGVTYGTASGDAAASNATAVVDTRNHQVAVACGVSAGTATLDPAETASSLVFTRIDTMTSHNASSG